MNVYDLPTIVEDEEPVLEGFELVAYVASDEARHILAELAALDDERELKLKAA